MSCLPGLFKRVGKISDNLQYIRRNVILIWKGELLEMTQIKERAMNIIQRLPDDKVIFVVNILEGLEGLCINQENNKTIAQLAYQDLQKYRKEGAGETDDKEELAQALEEKYESLG